MSIVVRSSAALVVAIAFAASLNTSRAEGVQVRIEGVGAALCSEVTARLQERPEGMVNQIVGWAYGYMSRRNIERGIAGQPQAELSPGKLDAAAMASIIVGACEKKPDARLYEVVDAMYEVLLQNGSLTS
jgi:hypothetical protein